MSTERYTPTPYEERASQKVGVWDYMKKQVALILIPVATGLLGYFAGKQQKLDPDFYQKGFSKDKSLLQKYIHFNKVGIQQYFGNPDHKGPTWSLIAAKVGLVVSAFLFWKQAEKKRLEVKETVEEVKDIAHLHQSNEELAQDNKLVKKMIAFEKEKQAKLEDQPANHFQKKLETKEPTQELER